MLVLSKKLVDVPLKVAVPSRLSTKVNQLGRLSAMILLVSAASGSLVTMLYLYKLPKSTVDMGVLVKLGASLTLVTPIVNLKLLLKPLVSVLLTVMECWVLLSKLSSVPSATCNWLPTMRKRPPASSSKV